MHIVKGNSQNTLLFIHLYVGMIPSHIFNDIGELLALIEVRVGARLEVTYHLAAFQNEFFHP